MCAPYHEGMTIEYHIPGAIYARTPHLTFWVFYSLGVSWVRTIHPTPLRMMMAPTSYYHLHVLILYGIMENMNAISATMREVYLFFSLKQETITLGLSVLG
jgi:hypothetical protein